MICPKCAGEMMSRGADGEYFPTCEDCGYVEYSPESLALQAEVRRDFERVKTIVSPDPMPTYQEAVRLGLIEP